MVQFLKQTFGLTTCLYRSIITVQKSYFLHTSSYQCKYKKPPVVTIMGHVDHGKTTLLDHLRNSRVVEQEFGGITQHIGAFVVPFKQNNKSELVTFLDTPGHAAFSAMRQRGANVTDLVVLVVACDDGVSEQTIESINYAKKSQVPIIVAINKIDKVKEAKDIKKLVTSICEQLNTYDVTSENLGGEVQTVIISALTGYGIDDLKEAILALAETLELKAETQCSAEGTIIEMKLDSYRGKVGTILVQRGILTKGDYIVAGTSNWARIRSLTDERGQAVVSCGPGLPVQITGWREAEMPSAGEPIKQIGSEKEAKSFISKFKVEKSLQRAQEDAKAAAERYEEFYKLYRKTLDDRLLTDRKHGKMYMHPDIRGLRSKMISDDHEERMRTIKVILKCDVDGSLDAILTILDQYDKSGNQPVKIDIIHHGVGYITENDIVLAAGFPNAIIYGFNTKYSSQKIYSLAKSNGTPLKLFNVIYHLVDDLKSRIQDKMPLITEDVNIGKATVIQEFIVGEKKKRIHVAGCRCDKGKLLVKGLYRLISNNEKVAENMTVKALKHHKENVKEIDKDMECGVCFESNESLKFKPGDIIECYEKKSYKSPLKWNIKGFN